MPPRPRRAVIVDESAFYRRILTTCLRSLGWETAAMESGYELVEYCMRGGEPFDVALLAQDMSLLDGVETARSLELFIPGSRIVLLGRTPDPDAPQGLLFLGKPVDFPQLIRWLQARWRDLAPDAAPGDGALMAAALP